MKIQLHVGTKADLRFNLRHFWPMKSFRRPRLQRKTDYHFKISGAIHCTALFQKLKKSLWLVRIEKSEAFDILKI